MRILGIDPGLANLGIGIIEYGVSQTRGGAFADQPRYIWAGMVVTPADQENAERIKDIGDCLAQLIDEHKPSVVAYEIMPHWQKRRSMDLVEQVIGVIKYVAAKHGVTVVGYEVKKVKAAVATGAASKGEVIEAVKAMLSLSDAHRITNHAADGLAVALTHIQEAA